MLTVLAHKTAWLEPHTIYQLEDALKFAYHLFLLGPHPWHMEIPLATSSHHSSQQCQIINPAIKARDQTHILMNTSWVHYH